MSVYQRPGVYVEESLLPNPPVVGANSISVAAFVGGSDRGPLTPTLVSTWSQYVNLYGGWNTVNSNDLPMAVFMFFGNGGSNAYIQRAIGNSNFVAALPLNDGLGSLALTLTALDPGAWGNKVYVSINNVRNVSTDVGSPAWVYDLVVYYGGVAAVNAVERYSSLSNDPTSTKFVETVLTGSNYLRATAVTSTYPTTTGSTPVALYGGADGDSVTEATVSAAVNNLDTVTNSLILNAAGVTTSSYVNQVLAYAEGRQDVFVVIDPSGTSAADQIDKTSEYAVSSFGASYYPAVVVSDPTSATRGATKTVSPSGAIIGLYAATDTSRGVFKAPAGLQARLGGVLSVSKLTNAELDSMNTASAAVNAIRYITGSGVVVMGARTLKSGYSDIYIPVRRTLIYLHKALVDLTQFAIFEMNDQNLWRRLTDAVTTELTSFWRQGGLRGSTQDQAFFVKCDSGNNTPTTIAEGIVNIEVGVALQRPAEFIVVKISQFEGGTTVTVA